jgi:antitoxin ParD1/3/4
MNINLGAQWENFIAIYVKSGRYLSASEVVREGLRLLLEREQLRQVRLGQLRNEIDKGIEQISRGEFAELDEQALKKHMKDVKARGRQRLSKRKPASKS